MKSSDDRVYNFWNDNFLGKGVFKFENGGEEFLKTTHAYLTLKQLSISIYQI